MERMERKEKGFFAYLVDLSGTFVEKQRGIWGHTEWLNFISNVQKRSIELGIELTEQTKDYAGLVLESVKKVYEATTATGDIEDSLKRITKDAANFVQRKRGVWGHTEWLNLISDIEKRSIELNEKTKDYIGGLLEAEKILYLSLFMPKGPGQGFPVPKEKETEEEAEKEAEEEHKQ